MKTMICALMLLVLCTGCTARKATTTTVGLLAAGACGAFGFDVDPHTFSSMAEATADLGFDAAEAAKATNQTRVSEDEDLGSN